MCGIAGILNIKTQTKELRDKALKMAQKIRHRGPDWSGIYVGGSAILAHERLSIVDPQSGGQPLYSPDRKQVLAVNGEIYNHRDIRARYAGQYDFQTGSDCEVILALYKDKGIHFLEEISGIFAFVLYDEEKDEFLIARDPIGVIPLYIGKDKDGKIYFGSELKALEGFCDEYEPFLPGHYFYSKEGKMKRWYTREWTDYESVKDNVAKVSDVKEALEDAVHRQLMSDVPYGVLLSGGLDSSVISAIAKKYAAKRIETDGASDAVTKQQYDAIHTNYEASKARYELLLRQKQSTALVKQEQTQRLAQNDAGIKLAEAELEIARLNLSYTVIVAPCDGTTGRKEIQEGQLIQPGQTVVDLVDLNSKWIMANYKETQTANILEGQPVEIEVDAIPGIVFKGQVKSISQATGASFSLFPQDNSAGNFVKIEQRIPIRIEFSEENKPEDMERLRAGMNVECLVNY